MLHPQQFEVNEAWREDVADLMTREATHQNIHVVGVPESELLAFIGEARQGFAEWFEAARG